MTDKPINPLNKLEEQMKVVFEEEENPRKIIDNLKSKLNEADNIVKLGNLGSSRFGEQNEKR